MTKFVFTNFNEMELKLKWRLHPEHKGAAIGQCKELPDSHCWFIVTKTKDEKYSLFLPGMSVDDYHKKIIVRDKEIAKDVCQDYLNYNFPAIVQHQIRAIQNTNVPPLKSISYYSDLIQKFQKLIDEHKLPPRLATGLTK